MLRAMLPVWTPEGERPERCRVWSAADDGTLSVTEPKLLGGGKGGPSGLAAHKVALPAACVHLAAASDGRLVCAAAEFVSAGGLELVAVAARAQMRSRGGHQAVQRGNEVNAEKHDCERHRALLCVCTTTR